MRQGVARWSIVWAAVAAVSIVSLSRTLAQPRPPNFILIFLDDSGWADTSVYGAAGYETPHIDQLAREGIRFTNYYVPQAVCSASRAALMTGSYSNRVGISGALPPTSRIGINDSERLLPQILKARGYVSGIFGKWHLGAAPQFLPTRHGFDEYAGFPYSNDMEPLPLMDNERALRLASQDDRDNMTTFLTERAISFIDRNRDKPFFLYVPHSMPHVPLAVSSKYKGKTSHLYSDVMLEIDWSVGQIANAVQRNGLENNTLIMFTSDNGPWLIYGDDGGSAGPLREGKQTTFDGGVREPFIARWPGHIKAGAVANTMVMSFDLLPTLARLAGAAAPKDRIIDGRDIWPWLSGKRRSGEAHEVLYFYSTSGNALEAVRSGKWKLVLPHKYSHVTRVAGAGRGQSEAAAIDLSLYDLDADPGESTNLIAHHPEVVRRMMRYVENARADLGDSLVKREGRNIRPAGQLPLDASPLPDGVTPAAARGRGNGSFH